MKIKTNFLKRFFWIFLINLSIIATLLFLYKEDSIVVIPFFLLYAFTFPFIQLLFSRWQVKRLYNLHVFEPNYSYGPKYDWYVQTVHKISRHAGMDKMPEVAIYESDDPNAFATGRSKKSSLVAVSSSLLETLSPDAIEAVIAHEIAHIMNGDMVTQTLVHATLNLLISILLFPLTICRWALLFVTENETVWVYYIFIFIESIIRTIGFFFANLIIKAFSRSREFQADLLAAKLTSTGKMVQALRELDHSAIISPRYEANAANHFNGVHRFTELLSTHPTSEKRIAFLQRKRFQNKDQQSNRFSWKIGIAVSIAAVAFSIRYYSIDVSTLSLFTSLFQKEDIVGEYILAQSSTEYLTEEDVHLLSAEQLRLARNEIYARHGFIFKPEELKSYFEGKSWYTPNSNFSNELLSELEHRNVAFIQSFE